MATGLAAQAAARYGRTERTLHWVHATAFCVLLGSGLCMYLPSLAEVVGRRPLLKTIHLYTALAWAIAIVLIVALGDRRALCAHAARGRVLRRATTAAGCSAAAPRRGASTPARSSTRSSPPSFAILFAISGFFLWYGERDTRFQNPERAPPPRLADVRLADPLPRPPLPPLILPTTRHSLSGITRGWVREDWAARHHAKWVEALTRRRRRRG